MLLLLYRFPLHEQIVENVVFYLSKNKALWRIEIHIQTYIFSLSLLCYLDMNHSLSLLKLAMMSNETIENHK